MLGRQRGYRWNLIAAVALMIAARASAESQCYGTVGNGRIEAAVKLPASGANYSAYSSVGVVAGRTYVHSKVAEVVTTAYAAVQKVLPDKVFIYGETGWASGGSLKPHRTHQNGLSVDFMVPVVDRRGVSVALPTGPFNKYGYDIEINDDATVDDLRVDFEAMGEHLFQLHRAAADHGIGLALVIFDPRFMPQLLRTAHGSFLRDHLKFMKSKPWVRHDEHYHVDFAVRCKPLKQ